MHENNKKAITVILVVLLFTSVDTLIFGTNSNRLMLFVPRIMGLLGIIVLPMLDSGSFRKIRIHSKDFQVLIILIIIMTVSSVYNKEMMETYLSRVITIVLAYTICHTCEENNFLKAFDDFVYIVSICAIITEIISYSVPALLLALPSVTNTSGVIFHTYFFGSIELDNISRVLIRANGVFWEQGAFAIYLIFALIIQLYILEKPNVRRIVVYLISLIITFSTTGYLALAVLMISYVLSSRSSGMTRLLKSVFLIASIIMIVISVFYENSILYDTVFGKLLSGTSSAATRFSSIYNGTQVALDNPILGVGSNYKDYMAKYVFSTGSRYRNGGLIITNTIISQFVSYGFIFGFIFLIGSLMFLKEHTKTKLEFLMLTLTMMMAYSGEVFFSFFPYVFMFYGLSKHNGDVHNENCID